MTDRDDITQAQQELGAFLYAMKRGEDWQDARRHLIAAIEAARRVLVQPDDVVR